MNNRRNFLKTAFFGATAYSLPNKIPEKAVPLKTDDILRFYTNGKERMRIVANSNLGIG